ncbi:MAG: outer membrane protein beta-barrel domain [Verrucomicrobiota bacterium]|jgi:hypothetical protein
MKPLTLTLAVLCTLSAFAFGGTTSYSGKEMKEVAPAPCPEWYGDHEWEFGLWGAYSFTGTESDRTKIEEADDSGVYGEYDKFLGGDHAWGGGIDAKYFFCRYFGVGLEAFGLDGKGSHALFDGGPNPDVSEEVYAHEDHFVGAALGTLTLRYPFRCTRFAPYVWAGGGGAFGGRNDRPFVDTAGEGAFSVSRNEDESRFMGQFGGGLEYRITRHIGITGDFSWNVLDGPHNNFGMVRSGLTFGF